MNFRDLLGNIWRRFPKRLRRWVVERIESRFTVTIAAIVVDDQDRVLLLDHVFRPGLGWGIPGGFINPGEQPEDALRRELQEEVELEVTDVKLITVLTHSHVKQVIIPFSCKPAGEAKPNSFEIKEAQWFRYQDLPTELSRDQRAMIEHVLKLNEKGIHDEMRPDEI